MSDKKLVFPKWLPHPVFLLMVHPCLSVPSDQLRHLLFDIGEHFCCGEDFLSDLRPSGSSDGRGYRPDHLEGKHRTVLDANKMLFCLLSIQKLVFSKREAFYTTAVHTTEAERRRRSQRAKSGPDRPLVARRPR